MPATIQTAGWGWVWKYFGGVLACAVGAVLLWFPIGGGLTRWSYDLPFALRGDLRADDAVIVYLDEASHDELKQPYSAPWDRSLHARLLDHLATNNARVVVFDILFNEANPGGVTADDRLAQAIKRFGRVVLAADLTPNRSVSGLAAQTTTLPHAKFISAGAAWGNAQLVCDPDLGIRKQFPNRRRGSGQGEAPTLAWTSARLAEAPVTRTEDNAYRERWLNYYGPPGAIESVSYYLNFIPDAVPEGFYSNRIVFVGSQQSTDYSGKGKDEFATPYTRFDKGFAPGVEVHATAFLNLLRGDWLTRLPRVAELCLMMGIGGLLGWVLPRLRAYPAVGVACGTAVLVAALAHLLMWQFRTWLAWGIILGAQIPVALIWAVAYNSVQDQIQKQVLRRSLVSYLPEDRVRQILRNPDLLKPGGTEQEITILFSDIANFTTIVERHRSSKLVPMLNGYFETSISRLQENGGTIIKLIGDAIFAIWNAPEPQADHREQACRAVIALRQGLEEFDRTQSISFKTRVGLHTGEACVGNFGSLKRFDYTAIGDAVNLASRLEGLNKMLGTETLASEHFMLDIEGKCSSRMVGHFVLKGFQKVVVTHEILGGMELDAITRPWRIAYADAWKHFQNREFKLAEQGFHRVIELRRQTDQRQMPDRELADDGPSTFHLKQIAWHIQNPPAADWMGEIWMTEK